MSLLQSLKLALGAAELVVADGLLAEVLGTGPAALKRGCGIQVQLGDLQPVRSVMRSRSPA